MPALTLIINPTKPALWQVLSSLSHLLLTGRQTHIPTSRDHKKAEDRFSSVCHPT